MGVTLCWQGARLPTQQAVLFGFSYSTSVQGVTLPGTESAFSVKGGRYAHRRPFAKLANNSETVGGFPCLLACPVVSCHSSAIRWGGPLLALTLLSEPGDWLSAGSMSRLRGTPCGFFR